MVGCDPLELTHERFAEEQRSRGGPAWQAAVDHGIDVTLLERNMALSIDERLAQHDEALDLYFSNR